MRQIPGDLPPGWEEVQLRFVAGLQSGSTITSDDIEEEGAVPVFGGNGHRGYTDRWTHNGDHVLIGRQGALCGNINVAHGPFWASEHAIVVTPKIDAPKTWLASVLWWLNLGDYSLTAAQPGISVEVIGHVKLPVPPLDERRVIAEFLDRETAQIDAMIDAQQRLVGLLVERRAALVDRLALGGFTNTDELGPARFATSGRHLAVQASFVNVPASWRVIRFKAALARREERNIGAEHTMMSLKSNGTIVPRSTLGERQEPDPDNIPRYLVVHPGELVVNPMWLTGGAIGVSNVVGAVSPDYRVFRSRGEHEPRYLHHLLRTRPYLDQYQLYTRAQTTFDRRVQQDDLDDLPLLVPALDEQREIVRQIDAHASGIDRLILQAERTVVLMRERRAALITAAVTGRIDPRTGVERLDYILQGAAS